MSDGAAGSTLKLGIANPHGPEQDDCADDFKHFVGERPLHFGHPIEHEFAKLLDYYELDWAYEPRTFPLRVSGPDHVIVPCDRELLVDGELPEGYRIVEGFSPDFYLPSEDTFVETTVMLQANITTKHKKIRHLHELYPEVKLRLLDRHDFLALAAAFPGRFSHVPSPGEPDPYGLQYGVDSRPPLADITQCPPAAAAVEPIASPEIVPAIA